MLAAWFVYQAAPSCQVKIVFTGEISWDWLTKSRLVSIQIFWPWRYLKPGGGLACMELELQSATSLGQTVERCSYWTWGKWSRRCTPRKLSTPPGNIKAGRAKFHGAALHFSSLHRLLQCLAGGFICPKKIQEPEIPKVSKTVVPLRALGCFLRHLTSLLIVWATAHLRSLSNQPHEQLSF